MVINEIFPAPAPRRRSGAAPTLAETNFLGRGINLGAGFVASTHAAGAPKHTRAWACGCTWPSRRWAVPTASACRSPGSTTTAASSIARPASADDTDPGTSWPSACAAIGGVLTARAARCAPTSMRRSRFRREQDSAQLPRAGDPDAARRADGPDRLHDPRGGAAASAALTRQPPTSTPGRIRSCRGRARAPRCRVEGAHARCSAPATTSSRRWSRRRSTCKMPRGHALGLHLFGGAISGRRRPTSIGSSSAT